MPLQFGVHVDALDTKNDPNRIGAAVQFRGNERSISRIRLKCLLQLLDGSAIVRRLDHFVDPSKPVTKNFGDHDDLVVLHLASDHRFGEGYKGTIGIDARRFTRNVESLPGILRRGQ